MKKLILTSICALSTVAAFGQGGINFANNSTPTLDRHPVYAPQTESQGTMIVGQSSAGSPSGTTVYDGGLVGSGYDFALFAGPVGAGSNGLALVTTVAFRSSASGALPQGTIFSVGGTVAGVPSGNADYQLRAWSTEGGTITDWATALQHFAANDPLSQIGWTPIITTSSVLATGLLTPPVTDFTTFSLIAPVPEPTTFALGGLGALGLLFFRRRK